MLFFEENFDFLTKISIFYENFDQNFDVWPKFRFLIKISIFDQNFDVWPKFRFLTKISIFDQKLNYWPKVRFFTKSAIFDQKCDFWSKLFFDHLGTFCQKWKLWFNHGKSCYCISSLKFTTLSLHPPVSTIKNIEIYVLSISFFGMRWYFLYCVKWPKLLTRLVERFFPFGGAPSDEWVTGKPKFMAEHDTVKQKIKTCKICG